VNIVLPLSVIRRVQTAAETPRERKPQVILLKFVFGVVNGTWDTRVGTLRNFHAE
jgi:hypothetical protein